MYISCPSLYIERERVKKEKQINREVERGRKNLTKEEVRRIKKVIFLKVN